MSDKIGNCIHFENGRLQFKFTKQRKGKYKKAAVIVICKSKKFEALKKNL